MFCRRVQALPKTSVRRAGNLFDDIVTWDNLRLAYYKAAKGKRNKRAAVRYRADIEPNLARLREQLLDPRHPGIGRYRFFTIHDPKERKICVAPFGDRVLHHAVMNVLEPHFDSFQIYDSYACRTGKGTNAALKRALYFARTFPYVAKLDVRRYFDSIDHRVLKELLSRRIKDHRVLNLLRAIIDTYQVVPGRGVPIGNLTSQYFANHYLGFLDHFAKENVGVAGWIRYMDDFLLFGTSKELVRRRSRAVEGHCRDPLRLELKEPLLRPVSRGIPFLGFLVKPGGIYLTREKRRRTQRRVREYARLFHSGAWSEEELAAHILPLFSHLTVARSRSVRNTLIERAGLRQ